MDATYRKRFAERLHTLCDEKQLPPAGSGRYVRLAEDAGVSYQAVKKWLDGTGFPAMEMAIKLAEWGGVNINWLLQGVPPMRGERVNADALALAEAISDLPESQRTATLQFLSFQLHSVGTWFAREPLQRYDAAIAHLGQTPPPAAAPPAAPDVAPRRKRRRAA